MLHLRITPVVKQHPPHRHAKDMQRLGIVLKYELECLAPRSVEQLGRVEAIGQRPKKTSQRHIHVAEVRGVP